MKTNREIHDKINEYTDILSELLKESTTSCLVHDVAHMKWVIGVIDALLWVIGDESEFAI